MRKQLKIIATAVLMSLAFVTLFDPDQAEGKSSVHEESPIHCCVQCCPAHNLAPIVNGLANITPLPILSKFLTSQPSPIPIVFIDPIFRPPRAHS